MLIRVVDNKIYRINNGLTPEQELEFAENNANAGFMIIDGLPAVDPDQGKHFKFVGDDIVPDEDRNAIDAQNVVNQSNRKQLEDTDWKVIRELERMYLSDTALNTEREELRTSIVDS